jgi:hypothetical protein
MEDGSIGAPGLLTAPQNKFDGYIQGFYPEFTVQAGDRFQAKVGCQNGQNCYVTYRLNYMNPNGWIGTFWQWREANDGKYFTADIDLTPLAGKKVRFILTILATGSATGDRAIWSSPRIVHTGGAPVTVTPAPPPTITPPQSTGRSSPAHNMDSTFNIRRDRWSSIRCRRAPSSICLLWQGQHWLRNILASTWYKMLPPVPTQSRVHHPFPKV